MRERLAYLAGIIDGEGCLLFRKQGNTYTPRLQVVNTYEPLIDWLVETYGGNRYTVTRRSPRANHKTVYHWHLTGGSAVELLRFIRPYLLVKHRQADILIAAWEVRNPTPRQYRRRPLDTRLIEERAMYHEQVQALNRKGVS